MYCTQCGNTVFDNDKFCSRCGKALSKKVEEQVPIVLPAEPEQFTDESLAGRSTEDPKFLKSFANSLAISIWWKSSLALLVLSLLVGFLAAIDSAATISSNLALSLVIILYLLIMAYAPFHTLRSLIGRPITLVDQGGGFAVNIGSIEVYPSPVSNNDNIALTWGFVWRLAVVSASLATPFRLTGYSPDSLEQFLVSIILLLLACWLAALWLVFVPYGKSRFRIVLSQSGQ
jgi:hypothetical protein